MITLNLYMYIKHEKKCLYLFKNSTFTFLKAQLIIYTNTDKPVYEYIVNV